LGQKGVGKELNALIAAVTAGFCARPTLNGLAEAGVRVEMSDKPFDSQYIANPASA